MGRDFLVVFFAATWAKVKYIHNYTKWTDLTLKLAMHIGCVKKIRKLKRWNLGGLFSLCCLLDFNSGVYRASKGWRQSGQ